MKQNSTVHIVFAGYNSKSHMKPVTVVLNEMDNRLAFHPAHLFSDQKAETDGGAITEFVKVSRELVENNTPPHLVIFYHGNGMCMDNFFHQFRTAFRGIACKPELLILTTDKSDRVQEEVKKAGADHPSVPSAYIHSIPCGVEVLHRVINNRIQQYAEAAGLGTA